MQSIAVCTSFHETDELTIAIPALPRPTLGELKTEFSWIKSIERDTSPTEAITLRLATALSPEEMKSIDGPEYERRIALKLDIILGFQQAVWLVEHQDEFPEFMALLGKVYIDFTGLVVVRTDGRRHFPFVDSNGSEHFVQGWLRTDLGLSESGRVAVAGK